MNAAGSPLASTLPRPVPNPDSTTYWNAAAEGRLLIRLCRECGVRHFMPRHLCPNCWSDKLDWIQSEGRGIVHSFSIVHRAPTPVFASQGPYVIALVDLHEGPRMFANVIGEGAASVVIGDTVRVVYEDRGEGVKVPQFIREQA